MRNILTITRYGDIHALLMAEAITRSGGRNTIWNISRFPRDQSISWRLGGNQSEPDVIVGDDSFPEGLEKDYDVVWFRRPMTRRLYSQSVSSEDQDFIRGEVNTFIPTLYHAVYRDAFWINDPTAKWRADAKLLQLVTAVDCGMEVPDTLVTNRADELRSFVAEREAVVTKSFHGSMWTTQHQDGRRQTYANYTALLDPELIDGRSVAVCPSIYQACINKKFELRILLCGSTLMAVKIDSQLSSRTLIDFRPGQSSLPLEEYELPAEVQSKILKFARRLGIVFGSFDFIVTPDEQYVFLEVNEQGQFLWIEENNPDIPILQLVTDFMLAGDADFVWQRPKRRLRLADVETDALRARYAEEINSDDYRQVCPPMLFEVEA